MKLPFTLKRPSVRDWVALIPLFFLLWYCPYVDFPLRVLTVAVGALVVGGAIFVVWRQRMLRWVVVVLYVLAALFLFLPSSPPRDPSTLRDSYGRALNSYMGCHYVWGGVGYFGIDCSGFVQKGLEDALMTRGLATLNPGLVREAAWMYWHRTTARVLGDGDADRTYTVTLCPTLNTLDYSLVQPGDLAVTSTGNHVLAYLGDKTWIAADADEGKVLRFVIPEPRNPYFFTPMRIVRWRILSG